MRRALVGVFSFPFGMVVLSLVGCGVLGGATVVVPRTDVDCPRCRPRVVRIRVAAILLALQSLQLGVLDAGHHFRHRRLQTMSRNGDSVPWDQILLGGQHTIGGQHLIVSR